MMRLDAVPRLFNADGSEADTSALSEAEASLIFLLSTTCPYCADTSPSWRQLVERARSAPPGRVKLYILSYSSESETTEFLRTHRLEQIPVFYMDEAALALNASSMPSTLVLKPNGAAHYWDGVLSDEDILAIGAELSPALHNFG